MNTWLVAEREMTVFLRSKGFWIGFGVAVVALFAIAILPSVFDGGAPRVAAVGSSVVESLAGKDLEVQSVASLPDAEQLVRDGDVEAAIVADGPGLRVVALSTPPVDVLSVLAVAPPVDLLDGSAVSFGERQFVIMIFSLVFLMFGMGGMAIAQSTVTEKQTRIVEILVSTVPVRALLVGKILGHSLLTIAQVVVLALAAPIAMRLGGHASLLNVVLPALGWFVPFVCLGFVLLAAVWAVAGSLVSRQEDLGSTTGVVMMLVMGPYFAVMFFSDKPIVMTVLSYVPFSSAVAMPVRMFGGEAAVWEAVASLGLLAVSVVAIVLLATRVYSGSLLHTGGKMKLSRAWARSDQ